MLCELIISFIVAILAVAMVAVAMVKITWYISIIHPAAIKPITQIMSEGSACYLKSQILSWQKKKKN
jgi:hypothetical protein